MHSCHSCIVVACKKKPTVQKVPWYFGYPVYIHSLVFIQTHVVTVAAVTVMGMKYLTQGIPVKISTQGY
jgi:hypothetical protein